MSDTLVVDEHHNESTLRGQLHSGYMDAVPSLDEDTGGVAWQLTFELAPADTRTVQLRIWILAALRTRPGADDFEIADVLGEDAFEIAQLLREMAREGLIHAR